MALHSGLEKLMKVRACDRFNGFKDSVFREAVSFVGVGLHEVAHYVVETLLIFSTRADFDIEQQPDQLSLRVIRNRVVVGVVTTEPGIPTGLFGAHETPPGSMFER